MMVVRISSLALRHHIQADDDAFELWLRRGVLPHHQRVMARDDVMRARSMRAQRVVGFEHVADMEGGGEGPARFHVLVVMGDVGGKDDPAAARMNADELHAWRVAADRM